MKMVYESPKLELCEFVVAARLSGSGLGTGHDRGQHTTCLMVSSAGSNKCDEQSNPNSGTSTGSCSTT